jgi:hypothetical protein
MNPSPIPSQVNKSDLKDPNKVEFSCDVFDSKPSDASFSQINSTLSEFQQDWFMKYNFFEQDEKDPEHPDFGKEPGTGRQRVYLELGSCLPYDYSNSVYFEKCRGWKGVCKEVEEVQG